MIEAEPTYTGERYVPGVGGPVLALEHEHRYELAARYADGLCVLDVGCGEGYGSRRLAENAREIVGVDVDEATIAGAAARYRVENLRFEVADAASLPFGDATFDLCVALECIEHVEDPRAMLDEVVRVLRPGGVFIASTPNRDIAWDADPQVNPFHKRVYSLDEFLRLLKAHLEVGVVLGQVVSAASFAWTLSGFSGLLEQFGRASAAAAPKYFVAIAAVDWSLAAPRNLDSIYPDADQRVVSERDEFWSAARDAAAQLEQRAGEVERLQRIVRALERQQLEAERELASLGDMSAQIGEMTAQISELTAGLEEASRRFEKSDRLLSLALGSRSWRITRPLRRLRGSTRPSIESLREAD
jgi:SAM-dependent methyltransferase